MMGVVMDPLLAAARVGVRRSSALTSVAPRRRSPRAARAPRAGGGDLGADLKAELARREAEGAGGPPAAELSKAAQVKAALGARAAEEGGEWRITGEELKQLVVAKWGRAYDTRLCQRRNGANQLSMYLQVMWKFVGQRSFPMTAQQYEEQLDAVAELLTEWGAVEQAVTGIVNEKAYPKVDTVTARAIMVPLDVDV